MCRHDTGTQPFRTSRRYGTPERLPQAVCGGGSRRPLPVFVVGLLLARDAAWRLGLLGG